MPSAGAVHLSMRWLSGALVAACIGSAALAQAQAPGAPAPVAAPSIATPPTAAPREARPLAADPALEARVLKVAEELRCLVCQNETIAASNADLAVDLRKQIRQKLGEGQSERQILDFMVERYGDFVLYRPPLKGTTVMLWAGPFALLLIALAMLVLNVRKRRQSAATEELSPAQAQRARELLGQTPPQP